MCPGVLPVVESTEKEDRKMYSLALIITSIPFYFRVNLLLDFGGVFKEGAPLFCTCVVHISGLPKQLGFFWKVLLILKGIF